jgi:hypothetical protein
MREDLKKNYNEGNDIFGKPQTYKNINLYPILLKDLKYQDLFYQVFAHPKNYIPSVDILKASYLKFLIYILSSVFGDNGTEVIIALKDMMAYLTKVDTKDIDLLYKQVNDKQNLDSIDLFLKIEDTIFDENDFDAIREIVLQQNNLSIEYVESYNPELEEPLRFLNRDSLNLTLGDQVFTFCSIMKIGLSEVSEYSLFQFSNFMEKALNLKEYDLYKPLLVSGKITLKSGDIRHYLYHSTAKESRYESLLIDSDSFMEKNKGAFGDI